jgi:hypothetical protein
MTRPFENPLSERRSFVLTSALLLGIGAGALASAGQVFADTRATYTSSTHGISPADSVRSTTPTTTLSLVTEVGYIKLPAMSGSAEGSASIPEATP